MSVSLGSTVGRYEIRELLGSGGMGEVYKAHDPMLGRFVALKLLRENLSADSERISRFLQEARAASALNHPNILTIHEVGEHQQSRFIVSELVEGETLRARLDRGALSLREVLDIAIQTASALSAAHAAGIVHRDIKPENLMLRPDGYVKVLDFGVAKLAPAADEVDRAATFAATSTAIGMVVGTMAYMAPEQARGLNVDGRADSFSLGVVLYELLAGRTPFIGATTSDVLVAVLDKEPPPLRSLARGLPLPLEWIIAKALEKDPGLRYQSMADFRVDLVRLKTAIESGRLSEWSPAAADVATVDLPLDVALTEESPQVQAVSQVSRWTLALAAIAVAAFATAMAFYDESRPGAKLSLQLPKGGVITKARDIIESCGYTNPPSNYDATFDDALNPRTIAALAGRDAVTEAVREAIVARWRVGFSSRDATRLLGADPQEGEFALELTPAGRLLRFATGPSHDVIVGLDRDRAVAVGLDAVRRAYGVDAARYDVEYVPRAFPPGTVELTWRNPQKRFGHNEQFVVHLQGERSIRLERRFETPPGFDEPQLSMLSRLSSMVGGGATAIVGIGAWILGLVILVRVRNWDALKQPLPIAIWGLLVVALGIEILSNATLSNLLGAVVLMIVLAGTVLPALSGLLLWIRRQSGARVWAADRLTRGRVFEQPVAASVIDGVVIGALLAAIAVLEDAVGWRLEGYLPSMGREVDAVDHGLWRIWADPIAIASLASIAIAVIMEALQWAGLRQWASLAIIGAIGICLPGKDHLSTLAFANAAVGSAIAAVVLGWLYRSRGLLATWLAMVLSAALLQAMASRSLDDPDRAWVANMTFAFIVVILGIGIWGETARRFTRRATPSPV